MTDPSKQNWWSHLQRRADSHRQKSLYVLLGAVLGVTLMALRSCGAEPSHSEHVTAPAGKNQPQAELYTCSMHPQIQQETPGKCPLCGMDLIPVASADNSRPQANRIVLSERARALLKLRTTVVARKSEAEAQLRLLGRIEPNETSQKTVTAWIGGRIDRLHVAATGQRITAGQVIATLYSPEVFAAHQDVLVAKGQLERMRESPETSRQAAQAALDAARQRLRLLGLPDNELAQLEKQDKPTRAVAIRTPFSGTVIERMASEGAYVATGSPLFRLADLSTVWVQLDAYESDLPRLALGQTVQLTVDGLSSEDFEGKITFIEPSVDPRRRTAKVRVQVANPDGRLRPGMFASASVKLEETDGQPSPLVVPVTAPLFTGRRSIVYVEVPSTERVAYEARDVRLGPRMGNFYPVVAGLSEGERVVARGAFALDADLQIRGGSSMMAAGQDDGAGVWDDVIELPRETRQQLEPIVSAYLATQVALSNDALEATQAAARNLVHHVDQTKITSPERAHSAWSELADSLLEHARHVAAATSLETARQGFEPLSTAVIRLLSLFGNPLQQPLRLAFCPMASGSEGALWVQQGAQIQNSYFGATMLECGEVRKEVAPGAFLDSPSTGAQGEHEPVQHGDHQH